MASMSLPQGQDLIKGWAQYPNSLSDPDLLREGANEEQQRRLCQDASRLFSDEGDIEMWNFAGKDKGESSSPGIWDKADSFFERSDQGKIRCSRQYIQSSSLLRMTLSLEGQFTDTNRCHVVSKLLNGCEFPSKDSQTVFSTHAKAAPSIVSFTKLPLGVIYKCLTRLFSSF